MLRRHRGPRPTIVLDHLASRWDRTPATLRDDVDRSAGIAVAITLTEVADGQRHKALERDGWTLLQDRDPWQDGEVAALVNDATATVIAWETVPIGPDLGPGLPVVAIITVIRLDATGHIILIGDAHMPSAVETRWGAPRGEAYRTMAANYRAAMRRYRRLYRPDAEVAWADWNLDLRLPWVKAWLAAAWPAHRQVWRGLPDKGTHGPRLIDFPLTRRLSRRRLRVLALTPGSDHRGIRLVARLRPRRKARR